MLLIEMLNAVN
ncbi:hypothetical protein F383_38916 [Gossypium arboreum]|uniref:Uncharacterized protein n=1 Tax=Gossypium arboreum TaxID=29729 RepID=A0A0B0MHJ4_GOSAR|nr:hypothetical protein F383_38916 [Gossypium arboreum]